jgi:DNA-binding MarR family transcriptional regulator
MAGSMMASTARPADRGIAANRDWAGYSARPGAPGLAQIAERMIAHQACRSAFLPEATSEDPQWLMILHLFVAAEVGKPLCVSDLCSYARVPTTTALRHIASLEKLGIFVRSRHPSDRRRSFLSLGGPARGRVAAYLLAVA